MPEFLQEVTPDPEETVEEPSSNDWLDDIIAGKPDPQFLKEGQASDEDENEEGNNNVDEDENEEGFESDEEIDEEGDEDYEDDEDEPGEEEQVDPQEEKRAQAFARMRKENTQYKNIIKQLAKAQGISEDEVLEKLGTSALSKRAEQQNLTPEALRKIEEAEARAAQAQYDLSIQSTTQKLKTLESTYNLDESDVRDFVQEMQEQGIDVLNTNMDFNAYYIGQHADEIVQAVYEQAYQKAIADLEAADTAPSTPDFSGAGGGSNNSKVIDSADKLDALFNALGKK